ncbi:lactonase family protein [Paracoccus aestuariivivens]|uniref:lactonase family protein n=1 Tax=Paracoccus aestuariivivens TaxID=1820333 RepID=UPI001478AE68|nr:lactonase family protein [Paracoccus aestuariivivens]
MDKLLLIGSYTESLPHVVARGSGITLVGLDSTSGRFATLSMCPDLRNPSYLAVSADKNRIFAVEELDETHGASVVALTLDRDTFAMRVTARHGAMGDCPCHVSLDQDEARVFVANYMSGSVATYRIDAEAGILGAGQKIQRSGNGPNPERQEGPHAHQVVPSVQGKGVFVCDAGTDEILHYPYSGHELAKTPDLVLNAPPGSLPRHLVQSHDGRRIYVVHELGCIIRSYACMHDGFEFTGEIGTLPAGDTCPSACAAIRLHPNGRYLYASNRGHDSITAIAIGMDGTMSNIGTYATRGECPRDFNISPSGDILVVANQNSHTLSAYRIDPVSGSLAELGEVYPIGSPTCVQFL